MAIGRYGDYRGVPTTGRINPVTDKDAIIPGDLWDPHYTDHRFTDGTTEGLTIFVDPKVILVPSTYIDDIAEDLEYRHSDRVVQAVGCEAILAASERAVKEVGNNRSARFIEHMLRHAFNDGSIWLGHMRAAVNRSNGCSYKVYGYRSNPQ